MTRTELRNYLQEIHELDTEIERLKHRISVLRDSTQQATSAYGTEPVAHSGNKHLLEDRIIERLDLEHTLDDLIESQQERKLQAIKAFASLSSPDYENVMLSRYISGKSWTAIAQETNRPVGTARRWDREALDELLTYCNFSNNEPL